MRPRLRLFTGEELDRGREPLVNVRFGEICQLLIEASRRNRTWVRDFADDEISVPSDLYEILMAYSELRPSA